MNFVLEGNIEALAKEGLTMRERLLPIWEPISTASRTDLRLFCL